MILPPILCSHCKKEFTPTKFISQRFCSIKCRRAFHSHKSNQKHYNKRKAYNTQYRKAHPEQTQLKNLRNRGIIQKWHRDNIDKIRNNKHKRLREDPNYKLKRSISEKLRQALRGTRKSQHTLELLGCSVEYLKMHLEALFQPGMTWDNWEQYGWHIDHILPISSFNLVDPEQQKLCFHYTNLQPLWWLDNIRKSNKVNPTLQNSI